MFASPAKKHRAKIKIVEEYIRYVEFHISTGNERLQKDLATAVSAKDALFRDYNR